MARLDLTDYDVSMKTGFVLEDPLVLPKCLAVPLYGMFEKQGFQPVITYADLLLSNTILKDPKEPAVIENFAAIIAVGIRVEQDLAEAMQSPLTM